MRSKSNRDAIGAIIEVHQVDGQIQTGFRTCRPSLGSGGSRTVFFGLGNQEAISHVAIEWPSGRRMLMEDLAIDQYHLIDEQVQQTIELGRNH